MIEITPETRGQFNRVWHCFGDSITIGDALGTLTPPPDHPLYALRSPGSTLEFLFAANGIADVVRYAGLVLGGPPNGDASLPPYFGPGPLVQAIDSRIILPGDVVVFEDAGPHGDNPPLYRDRLAQLVDIAACLPVTVLVLTIPDYTWREDSQWDRAIDGMSNNDAVRVAAVQGNRLGRVTLLDWNAELDWRRGSMMSVDLLDPVQSDGVHPNVWGQLVMVRLLLQGGLMWRRIPNLAPLIALLQANVDLVRFASPTMTTSRVPPYVNWLLRDS